MDHVLRRVLASAALLVLLHGGAPAAAQCTKDTDCKEARICERGTCIDPARVARPKVKVPPHPFDWRSAYVQVGGVFAPHAWFGAFEGGPVEVGIRGGVHVAGYGVSTTSEHLGGYFSYVDFSGGSQFGLGFSFKEGRRRFKRVWIGGAVDLGAYFLAMAHDQTGYGVQLFPRFELDVILGASSKTRAALFFAVGPMFVPYFSYAGSSGLPAESDHHWTVSVHLLCGVLFGS